VSTTATQPARQAPGGFRSDIQGLRAVAVSLVLFYHLWPNRLTGGFVGVDVFLVISGFLITSHLLTHPPRRGRDLAAFWGRRIRRLLPASMLVLAVTLVASRVVAPETQWGTTAREVVASALYVENWRLASTAVDYLAAENAASPVQHFWSLSVEEQFYLIWPVLVLLLARLALGRGWRIASTVLVGVGVVVGISLAYSVHATATEPASAYFVTPTRIWELGVGALLAAAVVRAGSLDDGRTDPWRASAAIRSVLAWAGFAAIAVSALTYTGATAFPGWRALLPVLGAASVIAAHSISGAASPGLVLGLRPVQWLGDVSYSVYLWHWPMVVLVPFVSGGHLGRLDKALIVVVTLLLAWGTKRFVEDTFRRAAPGASPVRPFRWAVAGMALVAVLGAAQVGEVNQRQEADEQALAQAVAGDDPCFGAAALAAGAAKCPASSSGPVVPTPAQAPQDKSDAYADDCWVYPPFRGMKSCTFGDPAGTVSVALVGNSHAGHWLPALQEIATQQHLKVTTFMASECTATATAVEWDADAKQAGCLAWTQRVLAATTGGQFDLVVTAERNGHPAVGKTLQSSGDAWRAGYRHVLKAWADGGTPVLVVHDTPFPARTITSPPECVAQHPESLQACSAPRDRWVPRDPLYAAARELRRPEMSTVDLTDRICTASRCSAVVGGVLVYFDGSHLTATYSRTLAPYLAGAVREAVSRSGR
jgi:peptidoglycan/LPS O-acetylase OafA/YrhL